MRDSVCLTDNPTYVIRQLSRGLDLCISLGCPSDKLSHFKCTIV